jgi:hypothetical protein
VGTTSTSSSTQGIKLRPDLDAIIAMADGQQAAYFGRLNSDGEIVSFKKDGTNVGSWMSRAGLVSTIILDPRTNGAGLTAAGSIIQPTNHAGVLTDGVLDLGEAPYRFKDLYLSGGVVFGPASASNVSSQTLSSYEEGTFTCTFAHMGNGTYNHRIGRYIKVGNWVTANFHMDINAIGTASGQLVIQGLPFTSVSTANNYGSMTTSHASGWSGAFTNLGCLVGPSTAYMGGYYQLSNGAMAAATHAQMQIGNWLGTIIYEAA